VAIAPTLFLWFLLRRFRWPHSFQRTGLFLSVAALTLVLVYQAVGLPLFFSGLKFTLTRVQEGRASFLWGNHSLKGWGYYFPFVFLVKTPLPLVVGLISVLILSLRKQFRPPWFLVLPPLVYFLLACFSSVQIGHRHILPIYPFLFVLVGGGLQQIWNKGWVKSLAGAMGLFLMVSTVRANPYYLSYFNELVGGPQKGYTFLSDSNVDWGQGLRALDRFLKDKGIKKIYLSYFGEADPHAHGLLYTAVAPYAARPLSDDQVDFRSESQVLLVVSVTNFHSTYFADRELFGWLRDRPPLALLANSLLVFDITHDPESHERLAGILDRMGKAKAAAQARWWAGKSRLELEMSESHEP